MSQSQRIVVYHSFHGGRFADHGVDVDALPELVRYKTLLVELAKELWRRNHPDRDNLPHHYEESLNLRFYEVQSNCATIPLVRLLSEDQRNRFEWAATDELDEAVGLVTRTIEAASEDKLLPEAFPKRVLSLFSNYGKTLRDDEWIEQKPADSDRSVRYDRTVSERLTRWLAASYEDFVDVVGTVNMARVSKPRMAIEIELGHEVEAAFRAEDEDAITTALKQHTTTKLRVIGRGQFDQDGRLQKIIAVDKVDLLPGGEIPFDPTAKLIWEEFADILSSVPQEEFEKLPTDGAERHDFYLHGSIPENP